MKSSAPLTSEQQMNVFRLRDKMSLLNTEFMKVFKGFYTEKNHYDFTGTMESYKDHVQKLRAMYKVDEDVENSVQIKEPAPTSVSQPLRKFAKAHRKSGAASSTKSTTESPKPLNTTIFAASSPAVQTSVPKFGDISVINKETPAPEPAAAPAAARKRAIRGGGPLGGSESVVFKSGKGEEVEKSPSISASTIPATTIKFPEPSKDFWTKKDTSATSSTPAEPAKSLFAFLGKDSEAPKETPKFSGFSFGKKAEEDKPKAAEAPKTLTFGSPKDKEEAPKSIGSLFGASSTAKPLSFGAPTAPTLSFGSSSGGLFAGLAQKAMDNQSKADGDEEEAEYVPPKVETVEAEEPDAVLSSKVSVFKFTGKEYAKLGVGMLHIKSTDGKHSLLIRAATTTGTVWLNALCNKAMKATKVDEKGERIRLTCPTSMTEMTTMMIRFGTADGAKKFTDKVDELSQ